MSNFVVSDLANTFIRAQLADGSWGNVSLAQATDEQFEIWARSRVKDIAGQGPWTLEERVDFCQWLEDRSGPLFKLVKGDLQ